MAFTYDAGALDEPINHVRMLCRDTREDDPILQDEEVTAFIEAESGNIYMAAAAACEAIALDLGRNADVRGEVGSKAHEKWEQYQRMAERYRKLGRRPSNISIFSGAASAEGDASDGPAFRNDLHVTNYTSDSDE